MTETDLRSFLSYPLKGDTAVNAVGGYISGLLSYFLLGAPLVLGYLIAVLREDSTPSFRNIGKILKDGFKAVAAIILCLAPGPILAYLLEGTASAIGFLLFLLGIYTVPMTMYRIAEGGLRSVPKTETLTDAFSLRYLKAVLAFISVQVVFGTAMVLSMILVVTVFLLPLMTFYLEVYSVKAFKLMYEA